MRFPHTHGAGLEAVLINISGGVADGDVLRIALEVGEGGALTYATPAAERIYRARPGAQAACIEMHARIGRGARLDYLPQETLLFEGCALDRSFSIDMDAEATFLGVEAKCFGRAASGEAITSLRLRDRISLRRCGRLVLHDSVRMQGDARTLLAASAGAGGCTAVATILFAAPDAQARLEPLLAALAGMDAGASCRDGVLMARLVAADGQALRRGVVAALKNLLGRPLPRLWAS